MSVRLFRKRALQDAVTRAVSSTARSAEIYPGTRLEGEGAGNDVCLREAHLVKVTHVCESCGELLAMHEHANYQQVKRLPCHDAASVRCVQELGAGMPAFQ